MADFETLGTYVITTIAGHRAIHCLLCDRISELAGDVENRYCGRCHLFHEMIADCRAAVASGAGHECGEWRTFRGVCALCGRGVNADGTWSTP